MISVILLFTAVSRSFLTLGNSWNSANMAELMTIVGIYVHAFFLIFAFAFPIVVLALESIGIYRKDDDYTGLARNAAKLWGITFAVGAVTGTLVEFGLVVLWSGSMALISSMAAAPLMLELYAFIIEIVLIGTYLTTFNRFKKWKWGHVLIGLGVLFGTNLSAYMILDVNAWMQVPWGTGTLVSQLFLPWVPSLGPSVVNPSDLKTLATVLPVVGSSLLSSPGAYQLLSNFTTNPWIAIFNPEAYATYFHNLLAALVITSFLAASYLSFKIIKHYGRESYNWKGLKVSFFIASIASFLQAVAGDYQGRLLYLFQRNIFDATEGIPAKGGYDPMISLLLYGKLNHFFPGINSLQSMLPQGDTLGQLTLNATLTYTPILHFLYYAMVISGVILAIISIGYFGLYSKAIRWIVQTVLRMKEETFVLYGSFAGAAFSVAASVSGWATREMGRHPWTVYGVVTYNDVVNSHAVTPLFTAGMIVAELSIFLAGIWGIYMIYFRKLKSKKKRGESH
ncbi:MAG: cytochrome ubiquinol oxidase subunit I [Candidatus Thermoplasmatota archaeon]|nr:cytochrome ubiquinol oxidase subunit I [Candidatus Thermoplasmatota archaeon]